MATLVMCDGCGARLEEKPSKVGYVIRREYCPTCIATVTEYQAEVDALHDRLAASWRQDLEAIRVRFRDRLNSLPDDVHSESPDARG
jgi:hypothetical protein